MTRVEDKARTRAALVDAAADEFATWGHAGARVERIAERAGVTTGALYNHFRSREDLFLAVYTEASERTIADLAALSGLAAGPSPGGAYDGYAERQAARWAIPTPADDGLSALADAWLARYTADVRWFRLHLEFVLAAVNDRRLHADLLDRRLLVRAGLAALLTDLAARRGRRLRRPAEELAKSLWALGNGLVLEWIVDPPSVSPDLFGRLAEDLFLAATEPLTPHPEENHG